MSKRTMSCTVEDLIRILKTSHVRWTGEPDNPFDLTAIDFQNFAKTDSQGDSDHNRVNALSNVKRAIECRIDELLYALCLHIKSEKENWNFPKKIKVLTDSGFIAPRILGRINRKRNQLEHQYVKPTAADVKDALDVAILFLGYTDRIYTPISRMEYNCIYSVIFDRKKRIVVIEEPDRKKAELKRRKLKIGGEDGWLEVGKILATCMTR